ncbi:MAG TPA: hypothetical protein VF181_01600, partial [Balneolaceae bacterium]
MRENKRYRERKSIRLKGWDYRTPAWYFITICTKEKQHFFGEIRKGIIGLSETGIVAYQNWAAIPDHFDHIKLDVFIVMPNHVHGLIGIMERPVKPDNHVQSNNPEHSHNPVETRNFASLQDTGINKRQFGPLKSGSISTVIHTYKSSVTRWARKNGYPSFAWQSRFHDHIVRNDESFNRIQNYII